MSFRECGGCLPLPARLPGPVSRPRLVRGRRRGDRPCVVGTGGGLRRRRPRRRRRIRRPRRVRAPCPRRSRSRGVDRCMGRRGPTLRAFTQDRAGCSLRGRRRSAPPWMGVGAVGGLAGPAVAAARRRLRGEAGAAAAAALMVAAYWFAHGAFDWFWEFPVLAAPALGFLGLAAAPLASASRGPG